MSYLLTEISMEMMGYKFYNLDGVYGQINFQKTSSGSSASNEKSTEAEACLEALIGFGETAEAPENVKSTNEKDEAMITVDQIDLSGMDTTEVAHTTSSNQTGQEQPKSDALLADTPCASSYKYSVQSEALLKLLDSEYERVRGQVMRENTQYLQESEAAKRMDQGKGFNANDFLKTYHERESKDLHKEVENMKTFRKLVEANLVKMNSKTYEKYVRTFMRIQPELAKYSSDGNS